MCEEQKKHTVHFFFFFLDIYTFSDQNRKDTKNRKIVAQKTIYDIMTKFYSQYVYMTRNIFLKFQVSVTSQ